MIPLHVLVRAYSEGAFPMADDEGKVAFYSSNCRAVFPIDGPRVSRRLARTMRSGRFTVTFDQAFEDVVQGCARPSGTWISREIANVFAEAHAQGMAHSCEVWLGQRLVGGLYGLALGGAFCAESMFSHERDASKVALACSLAECRRQGFVLFDAQVMSPHLQSMGAVELSPDEFMGRLGDAIAVPTEWGSALRFEKPSNPSGQARS